jgi:hypothetical protein
MMSLSMNVKDRNGATQHVGFDTYPDHCPRCHRSIDIKSVDAAVLSDGSLQLVCRCSSAKCDQFFIATYSRDLRSGSYRLRGSAPWKAAETKFQETIAGMSPMFVEIYNQAMVAESQQLGQLVGIGLRKSLEFLVKDFAIHQSPDDAEKIRKVMLGVCIENYVHDPQIKETAKRAAWLGNDETHYVRKWDDKDIRDLKLLVRLTTNWIDNVLLTQKYLAEMPPGS